MTIAAQPKLVTYLDDLIAEQGFGTSRGEVARTLIWQRIHELISLNVLTRRKSTEHDRARVATRLPQKASAKASSTKKFSKKK